jgi:AcrR family transcriptional regulator
VNSSSDEIADDALARQGRSGRRPGASGTRAAILAAARRLFAARGYDRTSLRAVAAEAGVDPALVAHFFGSKQRLFVAVVELPFDPAAVIPAVIGGDPGTAGERFARFVLGLLEEPEARGRITGLVRAAASEPEAAEMLRDLITREVLGRIVAELGSSDADLRASLAGSQVVGLVMARYVVGVEPLASLPAEEVAAAIGPTLQRYLTGPIS